MKKFSLIFFFIVLVSSGVGFAQDNIYGDYYIASLNKNISLDLEQAQLIDVLKMLSQETKLNFISTEAVRDRTLTLYIDNVPLKEAIDTIFKANNLAYDYHADSNIFVIKEMGRPTIELKTKVYHLRYARVQSSRFQKEIDDIMSAEEEEEEGEEEGEFGIKAAVESVLSELGRVSEDPITNSLIVVDVPSQFSIIDEVISELDIPIAKVMIEVEMLDVSKGTVDRLGINWPAALASLDMTLTQRATSFPFGSGKFANESGSTSEITTASATPSGWENVSWATNNFGPAILTVIGAELTLSFLRTQSDTKFLARPKILTLANQTAEIKITTDEAIGITKTESDNNDTTYEVERTETGTRLRVTPQVDKDTGEITLFVEMVVREAGDSSFISADFIAGTIKDPEERSTKTTVRLKDGETLFMGGLIKNTVSDAQSKIPILGDIPIIGRLFRHKNESVQERELMVFITPRVLKESPVFARRGNILKREQVNSLKESAVKLALEKFER